MDNKGFQNDKPQDSTVHLWPSVDKSRLEEDVHVIPLSELLQRYQTDPRNGLSAAVVSNIRAQYGENKLTAPKLPNYFWLLFKQLFTGFNSILWFAGVLAILAYKPFGEPNPSITNLGLGCLLFIVITCNSVLNVYQEIKSIKIVASFSKLLPTLATVRRDGNEQQVVTSEIVPGDIILIRMGDKLPADCRLLSCDGLKVIIILFLINIFSFPHFFRSIHQN
jgi:sodium/potassium-transporting ATPase subunit alpha